MGPRVVQVGDVAHIAFNLNRHMNAAGENARLFIVDNDDDGRYAGDTSGTVEYFGSRSQWNNARLAMRIMGQRRRVDLFHGHGLMNIVLMCAGVPYVAHYHGTDVREVARSRSRLGALVRASMRRARHILVSTSDMLTYVADVGIASEKVTWLPSPIDSTRFHRKEPSVDLHRDCEVVLFHPHRFQAVKRNELLFQAFSHIAPEFPEVALYWVDHGSRSPDAAEVISVIEALDVGPQLRRLPRVSSEEMVEYYNACDILMDFFNQDIDGVTLTAVEAFLCERVVVGAITDNEDCYVHSSPMLQGNSVEDIEEAIRDLLSRRQDWPSLGQQGRQWARSYHEPSVVLETLQGIYAAALSHHG